jgi:SAM-dependent methyltransferase
VTQATAVARPLAAESSLGHEEAAVFETFVVPNYLSFFGERLVAMLAPGQDARVCHVLCRTGYPDEALLAQLPNAHIHGCDPSKHAIELARAKAAALVKEAGGVVFDYRVASLPLPFPPGAFSHAFCLHPIATPPERSQLLLELARIVAPHGQALFAVPLRGSFVEIGDLLREYALKYELVDLVDTIDAGTQCRPTDDMLKHELEVAGFEYVEVDVRKRSLRFPGGRAFLEDPISRLLLIPEFRRSLGPYYDNAAYAQVVDPFRYVGEAIDKYWSDGTFEMTVSVGVVSGRRKG